LSEAFI